MLALRMAEANDFPPGRSTNRLSMLRLDTFPASPPHRRRRNAPPGVTRTLGDLDEFRHRTGVTLVQVLRPAREVRQSGQAGVDPKVVVEGGE